MLSKNVVEECRFTFVQFVKYRSPAFCSRDEVGNHRATSECDLLIVKM